MFAKPVPAVTQDVVFPSADPTKRAEPVSLNTEKLKSGALRHDVSDVNAEWIIGDIKTNNDVIRKYLDTKKLVLMDAKTIAGERMQAYDAREKERKKNKMDTAEEEKEEKKTKGKKKPKGKSRKSKDEDTPVPVETKERDHTALLALQRGLVACEDLVPGYRQLGTNKAFYQDVVLRGAKLHNAFSIFTKNGGNAFDRIFLKVRGCLFVVPSR
jgi:hypothetical protein